MCNEPAARYTSSSKAMSDDDAALARRIAERPGEAREDEEELARRFAPRIRLYGLRHLRDRDAADDLVQQVLLVTLESLRAGRVREPERLASFILGTCRNVAVELRRGGRRRQALLDRYLVAEDAMEPVLPPPVRLADCLQRLAERDRSVLVMTFYAERSADEIAGELGLAAGNVRVVRHRALGRLRECLEARA